MKTGTTAYLLSITILVISGCTKVDAPRLAIPITQPKPKQVALIALPAAPTVNPKSLRLIEENEVGTPLPDYYLRHLLHPDWPQGESGVTIGIGYDCGYNSKVVILQDWAKLDGVERLADLSGIHGRDAKSSISRVKDILVEWGLAQEVFLGTTVTKFFMLCARTYPGFDKLRPNAQGALLSVTFNRGASMSGPRRVQMRNIRDLVPSKNYEAMADEIEDMIPIWKGTAIYEDMRRRRLQEAELMRTP